MNDSFRLYRWWKYAKLNSYVQKTHLAVGLEEMSELWGKVNYNFYL
jgi:hypothetical protein